MANKRKKKTKPKTKKNKLKINAISAIKPKNLYLIIIKRITKENPNINAIIPALIESSPSPGPTVRSSIIFIGAGNAPDLNNKAKSVAD